MLFGLWIWFFGCISTYKFGKWLLVEGMGIKSAEFFMLCLYSLGIAMYLTNPLVGKWTLLVILMFWIVVQFFCHWYYTIFGVTEKKLKGYNKCFRNTVRIIPMSNNRIIPDFYHMVLHLLIVLNIILMVESG